MRATFFGALAVLSIVSGVANASTINIDYYSVSHLQGVAGSPNGDFGVCCESGVGKATLPNIAVGDSLSSNGLPVSTFGPNPVQSVNASGEILWWSGVVTGTSVTTLPFLNLSMYTNGLNNNTTFQTAILYGTILGSGSTVLSVRGDDDVLVYIDGKYVGGTPGVHDDTTANLLLNLSAGPHALKVFYADRAEVGAKFGISIEGGEINASPVPGPIVGAGLPGLVMALGGLVMLSRRRRNVA